MAPLQTMNVDMDLEVIESHQEHSSMDMELDEEEPVQKTYMSESQRRASIKAILADKTISESERRLAIQSLMDGRSRSANPASSSTPSCCGSLCSDTDCASKDGSKPYPSSPHTVILPPPSFHGEEATFCMPVSNEMTQRAEQTRPSCDHYERKCTMIAPCCGGAFGCRICHDESPVLPPKKSDGLPKVNSSSSLPSMLCGTAEDNHHTIDRFAVKEVICQECFTRQSSKTNNCIECGVQFGEYHCGECNLWMSKADNPYHCEDCGFCRLGGEDKYVHCHDCDMCIDSSLYATHHCQAGKYKSNCPVCQEYLFSSRSASHEMPCGHAIHWDCFRQMAAHDCRCPICKKTAETNERMMPTWEAAAAGIALQPIPPEMARVVNISCIDCETSDRDRPWHFLGIQCRSCSSFNTLVDDIVMTGEQAHEFLEKRALRDEFLEWLENDEVARETERQTLTMRRRSSIV